MFLALTDTLSIILLSLVLLGIVVNIVLQLKKPFGAELDNVESTTLAKIDQMKTDVIRTVYDSMLKFNQDVNNLLRETSDKSGENITEFRINVNKELIGFQEKLTGKLQEDFKKLTDEVNQKLYKINEDVDDRLQKGFRSTNETFIQIVERVKIIDEAQKKIESLSNEMISLQNILSNNQARGSFGEYQLNQLLFSVFGDNNKIYEIQHTIKEARGKQESVRADAVIFMPEPHNKVAIDSKFPFSSYAKLFEEKGIPKEEEDKLIQAFGSEVKKHITDIGNKYIIDGVTANYALMFVASDGVLALIHAKLPNIVEYAREKRVTIVSPTTIIPLLSSFQAARIDYEKAKNAKIIDSQLKLLNKEFEIFSRDWTKLNQNIRSLSRQSDAVDRRVIRITDKFGRIKNADFSDKETDSDMEAEQTEDIEEN
ncbi:MAG: DNA recombination protein RmuC [Candidatus Izemoplasmatales bacterium]|jgi:DNA recombination protein RmuC